MPKRVASTPAASVALTGVLTIQVHGGGLTTLNLTESRTRINVASRWKGGGPMKDCDGSRPSEVVET